MILIQSSEVRSRRSLTIRGCKASRSVIRWRNLHMCMYTLDRWRRRRFICYHVELKLNRFFAFNQPLPHRPSLVYAVAFCYCMFCPLFPVNIIPALILDVIFFLSLSLLSFLSSFLLLFIGLLFFAYVHARYYVTIRPVLVLLNIDFSFAVGWALE